MTLPKLLGSVADCDTNDLFSDANKWHGPEYAPSVDFEYRSHVLFTNQWDCVFRNFPFMHLTSPNHSAINFNECKVDVCNTYAKSPILSEFHLKIATGKECQQRQAVVNLRDEQELLTPEDYEMFKSAQPIQDLIQRFLARPDGLFAQRAGVLIVLMSFGNGARMSAFRNLKGTEVMRAVNREGYFTYAVADHKTSATHGPCFVTVYKTIHSALASYVASVQMKFGSRKDFTLTKSRKMHVVEGRSRFPERKEQLAVLMSHRPSTGDRFYDVRTPEHSPANPEHSMAVAREPTPEDSASVCMESSPANPNPETSPIDLPAPASEDSASVCMESPSANPNLVETATSPIDLPAPEPDMKWVLDESEEDEWHLQLEADYIPPSDLPDSAMPQSKKICTGIGGHVAGALGGHLPYFSSFSFLIVAATSIMLIEYEAKQASLMNS
ncbi:hypothetical protein MAR_018872 [Mya arenaria]|uniref:Uncharacterized protein n=1 Tax=Mya arenaria TaxID=6604 RepID=A0ABY7EKI5_MYAAR|nr:hypothetical protein MAR_018872 [Mya arenaria]